MGTRSNFFVGALMGALIGMLVAGAIALTTQSALPLGIGAVTTAIFHGVAALVVCCNKKRYSRDKVLASMGERRQGYELMCGVLGLWGAFELLGPYN